MNVYQVICPGENLTLANVYFSAFNSQIFVPVFTQMAFLTLLMWLPHLLMGLVTILYKDAPKYLPQIKKLLIFLFEWPLQTWKKPSWILAKACQNSKCFLLLENIYFSLVRNNNGDNFVKYCHDKCDVKTL